MTEREAKNRAYPLLTMLIGLASFSISGIVIGLISLKTNEELLLILGTPIGSLLMLFILGKLGKDKILSVIIRSELGGFIGFLAGFMIGELLAVVSGFLIPSLRDLEQVKAQILPNIVALIAANAVFGALLGDLFYGRKSIRFFALACGIASIPFGILLSMPFHISWISFDQNILFMLVSFGTTTGLAMGLYRLKEYKDES